MNERKNIMSHDGQSYLHQKETGPTHEQPFLTQHADIPMPDSRILEYLYHVIQSRKDTDPNISYSAKLLARGTAKIAQKFGEEAVECVIEAVTKRRDLFIKESADVLYHLMVLWVSVGVTPAEVWTELQRREGVSGIVEKESRSMRKDFLNEK